MYNVWSLIIGSLCSGLVYLFNGISTPNGLFNAKNYLHMEYQVFLNVERPNLVCMFIRLNKMF